MRKRGMPLLLALLLLGGCARRAAGTEEQATPGETAPAV